ncbi:Na/Pi cotransporter family protein [Pelosinus sp. sgz500959]|uniref:Na/Pi cotransporter family protein n=1 Tax=Pelosinus sp. sgz500959 TaxID=3242472 RepID=UPI0036735B8F
MYEMIILSATGILLLLGGIALMRFGLQKLLLTKLKKALTQLTKKPWRGVLLGTLAAAMMQSSTAVSLLTIGLVSANYLSFYEALGIILGANIGTCSTVQLMTITMPSELFLPLLAITLGISLTLKKIRWIAMAIAGLLSIFLGITILSDALSNLSEMSNLNDYLIAGKENPLYGIMAGIIITLLFQSSSAATGVLMALASDGMIDLTTASYIVYGNNIGSCLSSIIVGAAGTLAAKRIALSHVLLNIIGVAFFLPLTSLLTTTATYITADFAGQVAIIHTLFNILSSLAILPIIRQYANLIIFLIPDKRR